MSELSREDLANIIEKEMPGYTLAEAPPVADAPPSLVPPQGKTIDFRKLQEKLGGPSAAPPTAEPDAGSAPNDFVTVVVQPKSLQGPLGDPPHSAIVIISTKTKKLVSVQG